VNSGAAPDTVVEVEAALSDLVRLFNRPAVQRRLMAQAGVAIEVGAYWALGRIGRIGPCRLSELAASLGVDASTITHRVQALEQSGYVERLADPADGRAAVVHLSPEGSAALLRLRATRRALFERLVASWDDGERRRFTAALERIAEALTQEIGEP
jgi:DNA-binding MarR family transcriptional regulator